MKTGWKQNKIILILLFGILACFFRVESLKAASGSIVLTTKETSVDRGEKVHVIVSIEADSEIGDFEAYVKYDSSFLQFVKGGSYMNEEGNLLKISHMGDTEGETSRKYAIEFTALKRGKSKVSLKDNSIVLTELESDRAMSLSTNDVTVTIAKSVPSTSPSPSKEAPTKTTAPSEERTPEPTRIPSKNIDEDSEDIIVNYVKKGSKLTVKGTYEYKIVEVKKEEYIPAGYTATKIKIDGVNVNAYHSRKEDSDFVLLYLQNADDQFGYYRYDTKEKTLQRYQRENIDSSTVAAWSPDQVMLDHYRKKVNNLYLVIGIFVILLVLLSMLSVWLLSKKQRR